MTIVRAMGAALKLNECYDEASSGDSPPHAHAVNSNSDGGNVEDILKRLGVLESTVSDIREKVSGITATIAHLATQKNVSDLETAIIKWIIATVLTTAALVLGIVKVFH
jgi:hypothetical protein